MRPGKYFWSDGYSWGNVIVGDNSVLIAVHFGKLEIKSIRLQGGGKLILKTPITIGENNVREFNIR